MTLEPVVASAARGPGTRYTLSGSGASSVADFHPPKDPPLPKPNYAFQKRQRDLAKQQKKQEKQKKKDALKTAADETAQPAAAPDEGAKPGA